MLVTVTKNKKKMAGKKLACNSSVDVTGHILRAVLLYSWNSSIKAIQQSQRNVIMNPTNNVKNIPCMS